MHDLTTFEALLVERLESEFGGRGHGFDAARIASESMVGRGLRDRLLLRVGLAGALPLPGLQQKLIFALVAAALVLVTLALAVGVAPLGGDRLALVRQNGDVVFAAADGTGQHVVGNLDVSPLRTVVSWAPDGGHLAYLGDDLALTIIDREGIKTYSVTLADRASQFAWSPDGRRLAIFDGAFVDHAGDGPPIVQPTLKIVAPDGTLDWAVPLPADFRYVIGNGEVVWSRDGHALAITGYSVGPSPALFPSSIWVVDTKTRTVRELRSGSETNLEVTYDVRPRWLPDGRILFSRQHSGIWRVDPSTGVASMVYRMEPSLSGRTFIDVLEPSPDGASVAFMAPNVWLGILDLATAGVTEARLADGGIDLPITWTPDGDALITRWGERTDEPFFATHVARLDFATGETTILANDVVAYSMRP